MDRKTVLANIAVASIVVGISALQVYTDRRDVIEGAYLDAQNLASALTEHTRHTFMAVDMTLATVASMAVRDGEAVELASLHPMIEGLQNASVATLAYFALDEQGKLVATSRTPAPDPVDLSVIPEFRVHIDGQYGRGGYLGPPRKGRVGYAKDRWVVNISRRIEHEDGGFAGVAAATLSLDYLLDFYDALRIGEQGVVGLVSGEATLIVRSPFDESVIGRDIAGSPLNLAMREQPQRGRFTTHSPIDGVERITAYERIGDSGAVLYVGLGRDEILAAWRRRAIFQGAVSALVVVLFLGVSTLTSRYLARQRAWEAQRTARMKMLADESAMLVRCPDIGSLLDRVTGVARRMIGAHQAVASLTRDRHYAQAIHGISLSEKYRAWQHYDEPSDGSGIYRLVCEHNRPMRLTQAELEVHPDWRGFGQARERHPPMRGWLAVPIVSQDGSNLGLIQLSDKKRGEFTDDDLHELAQLANVTGIAIDNLLASQARERALAEATAARQEIETIFNSISDAVYALDPQWNIVFVNAEAERLLSRRAGELVGRNLWEVFPEARQTELYSRYLQARTDNAPTNFEFFYPPFASWYAVRAFPHSGGLTVYFHDITRRVESEERLRQAQKMDAIGQLTGGIAHDFNNLLTVILGSADELAESFSDAPQAVHEHAAIILNAGERAAELTRRLLAFARKQPLDPKQVDINALVGDVEGILRRILGETIQIELVRGGGLWRAIVDPSELQNAILNLAINARDAMPEGGSLTIETANVAIDHDYADIHDIEPGQYVMVAVSDTGVGMSAPTIAKAFDPFFTTKPTGKGTGLGLSMVYGFARQSGGYAKIYSEPGEGTTIKLYLPRAERNGPVDHQRVVRTVAKGGGERVLVVEDEDLVRRHTVDGLRRLGYTVVGCEAGREAIGRLETEGPFDLLLTDVVLPGGMSGRQVAEEAALRQPSLRVLYMSGYTENAIVHHGRLDPGVQLLNKPFRLADLARKVRAVLDSSD